MKRKAGPRKFIMRVEQHNGKKVGGEPTYNNPSDWNVYISQMPVTFRGLNPGTLGGEVQTGKQLQSIITEIVEVLATPLTMGITPTMRIIINGRTMGITNIYDPKGEGNDLTIQVKEVGLG